MGSKKKPEFALCHSDRKNLHLGLCSSCYHKQRKLASRSECHPDRPSYTGKICARCFYRSQKATCHPDRSYASRGMCSYCYKNWVRANNRKKATCHPERPHWSAGLCHACYAHRSERRYLLKMQGLTEESFQKLVEKQNSKCGNCGRAIDPTNWHLDHDHVTGAARGLLCRQCNNGLGLLGDTIETIERVLNYLKFSPASALINWETVNPDNKVAKRRRNKQKARYGRVIK